MNTIAKELNARISQANPHILDMLSSMGKALFFPKGILSQSAEAKVKAHQINATIGIAKQGATCWPCPLSPDMSQALILMTICHMPRPRFVGFAGAVAKGSI